MTRVPLVERADLPPEKRPLLDTLDDESPPETRGHGLSGGTLNVYRSLANDVGLLEAFRRYGTAVWEGIELTPQEREIVILATAAAAGSEYEWHQHVRVALDAGVPTAQIRAVSGDRDALPPERAALAAYTERFVEGSVDDASVDRLRRFFHATTLVGVGQLAGLYLGLARQLDALDVDTEGPFVGWELERL
ncbi:carboxymuconolactone decarboxylase family protein [Salinigranum marinum]|uniref:carboxymuconolactone decarboxylase family protein n=1 Tax=Salinigranum marinum TaxID=1515595 RepID=UPI002989AD0E|nr:carboxymuconolactone decarboxylase family protein [Salinigranum marinum]